MIDILNGYDFKRNNKNVVVYQISKLAGILGIHPHEVKEHYFFCVLDDCLAQGEFHTEEIINNEIELYLPVYNLKYLIDSLVREGFKPDEFQSKSIIDKMLETQNIVSECFDFENGFQDYTDPIRKYDFPFIKDIKESISKHMPSDSELSEVTKLQAINLVESRKEVNNI